MTLLTSTYSPACAQALDAEKICLYQACSNPYHFCHHPALGVWHGRLYAMWSNSPTGEDEIGQRVLYCVSEDGVHFSAPQVLCAGLMGSSMPYTLTAAGFYAGSAGLVAYVGAYEYASLAPDTDYEGNARQGTACTNTHLFALTSADGVHFSPPVDVGLPICPNLAPRALQSGRLLLCGNWSCAYTDQPDGLTGWHITGFQENKDALPCPLRDDPFAFHAVSEKSGYPSALCECSFVQEKSGALHMLYRSRLPYLYQSDSRDNGASWSTPVPTDFPNGASKFYLFPLPDGRYAAIYNPSKERCPLVLSLSEDGVSYTRHFLLESTPVNRQFPGVHKHGMYGYPHAVCMNGWLYVIYSLWKEDVFVLRIRLDSLS